LKNKKKENKKAPPLTRGKERSDRGIISLRPDKSEHLPYQREAIL
jgi:hypothetical protein